jgi:protein subunit release factor B
MFEPHELRITTYLPQTGHGAGGMTVGMTTSGVIVHHISTGIGVSCDSERSQYANKEKAIQLLERLVQSQQTRYAPNTSYMETDCYIPQRPVQRTMANKVAMIKEVREKTGSGLRECKNAVDEVIGYSVDFDDVILKATLLILSQENHRPVVECAMPQGHPTHCGCGGYC